MADTHINAYRAEALDKLAAVQVAQGEADQAVAAYVAQGGKAADVLPQVETPSPTAKVAVKKTAKAKSASKKPSKSTKGAK